MAVYLRIILYYNYWPIDLTGLQVERATTTEMSILGVTFIAGLQCGMYLCTYVKTSNPGYLTGQPETPDKYPTFMRVIKALRIIFYRTFPVRIRNTGESSEP